MTRRFALGAAGLFAVVALLISLPGSSDEEHRQYTFAWPFAEKSAMRPRGGTTTGPAVELFDGVSPAWEALREPGLSAFERDRRAILAMAGEYRTTFDFIETVGLTPGFVPSRPYQSWATELIFVVEDREDFISLQHVIVMRFVDDAGEVSEPIVQKHWRQDWQYEDTRLIVYAGLGRWHRVEVPLEAARGRWSQAVYQVDDSPRYEALGEWTHSANFSSWASDETWRPLPQREVTVRDDYDVLVGTNRHTITPVGWVQEEHNLKLDLAAARQPATYLAREVGLNRYERIVGFDFSPGEAYWENTQLFWADVRAGWQTIFETHDAFVLREEVDGRRLFEPMFAYAEALRAGALYDAEASQRFVSETLARYVRPE